jgi:replicative DNA helicase
LKELSSVFDTNTLEQTKNKLATLIDEEQFSMEKSDCIEEIKHELFHQEQDFITTGSRGLDSLLGGGFEKAQMNTLAGRPGMGKTSYALQLAIGRKKLGLPTMVFTMEMKAKDMMKRLISQDIGISMNDVGKAKNLGYETLQACERSADDIHANGVELVARASLTIPEIKSHIRSSIYRARQEGRKIVDFVVIDYLGLVSLPKGSDVGSIEYAKLTELSREIKKLAMECDVAILILAQLNRGVEGRDSAVPKLSDLRGSGAIEQDSNKVLFVYRKSMYEEDAMERNQDGQLAHLIIAKNREGAVGTANYNFYPQTGVWNEY